MRAVALLCLLVVVQTVAAQSHRLSGVIKDTVEARVPGLSLAIEKDGKPFERNGYAVGGLTDVNGRFTLELPAGNYKVTAVGISENRFRIFLTITDSGPNPDFIESAIDAGSLCEADPTFPTITKSVSPFFPPAARAVRALGTVSVMVKVLSDGSVSSAAALSGHPLLRTTSMKAAREFAFEPAESVNERGGVLQFIFLDSAEAEKGEKVFECPRRILVFNPPQTIEFSRSH